MNARDAEREARHARPRSIEKRRYGDKGKLALGAQVHPEMFVKYLAFSDGGGALTAPAAAEEKRKRRPVAPRHLHA